MDAATPQNNPDSSGDTGPSAKVACGMGVLIFSLALCGILTRPVDYLAVFWPANAVLLGLMAKHPRWAAPRVWMAVTIGYVAADLITGSSIGKTLWLTGSNLAGVMSGLYLFSRLENQSRYMERHRSALYLFLVSLTASLAATATGCLAGPLIFQIDIITTAQMWLCAEFVNYLLILPVVLGIPHKWPTKILSSRKIKPREIGIYCVPLIGLVIGIGASVAIGGTGAMAIPFPALLWCALTYPVFATAVLSMTVCFWQLYAAANGVFFDHTFSFTPDHVAEVFSLRIGAAMMMLGPLAVAISNSARKKVLQELEYSVQHDQLTKALSRGTFFLKAERLLLKAHRSHPVAVLMVDIDHFKRINDSYGHAAGDEVLRTFAMTVSDTLRQGDLFGRLGGEEFAIFLHDVAKKEAWVAANRIRQAVSSLRFLQAGQEFFITASIGLVPYDVGAIPPSLEHSLLVADQALYKAKTEGRDQIVCTAD